MINNQLLTLTPMELLDYFTKNFTDELPSEVKSVEDMNHAAELLLKLTEEYSYICSLLSLAKIMTRDAKRHLSKEEYEDMVDRKEIIQNMADVIKQKYAAISRAVTIKLENNAELRMTGNGYINR